MVSWLFSAARLDWREARVSLRAVAPVARVGPHGALPEEYLLVAPARDPSPWPLPPEVTVRAEYDAEVFARFAGDASTVTSQVAPQPLARGLRARLEERWNLFVDAVLPLETEAIHAPHAAARIDALAPSHDLLWTTSYPIHSHWLGVRAAKKHRKPLVVDLRDPWTPNWSIVASTLTRAPSRRGWSARFSKPPTRSW